MFLLANLLGLPAHPLVVHGAVVLVPLAVLALAITGWRKSWQERFGLPVMLLSLAGGFFAFLADQSGEPLEGKVKKAATAAGAARPNFGEHPDQGGQAFTFAAIFAIAALLFWLLNTYGPKHLGDRFPKWAPFASYVVVLLIGAVALFTMLLAGHSGAQLVWKDVGSYTAGK